MYFSPCIKSIQDRSKTEHKMETLQLLEEDTNQHFKIGKNFLKSPVAEEIIPTIDNCACMKVSSTVTKWRDSL